MKIYFFLVVYFSLSAGSAQSINAKSICAEYKSSKYSKCEKKGFSLGCLSQFLYDKKLISTQTLGAEAQSAADELLSQGFQKNTELTESPDKIPTGSVVIFSKLNSKCPVGIHGDIGFKCDDNTFVTNDDGRMVAKPIALLNGCIKDVLTSSKISNFADPHGFCQKFKTEKCKSGLGLACVSGYFQKEGLTSSYVHSAMAKDSVPAFEGAGFDNLLTKNPALLKDVSDIPEGSVVVFSKSGGDCPVSKVSGNVGIKCDTKNIVWDSNGMKTQSLDVIAKAFPDCIKAVLQHPGLKGDAAAIGSPGNPESATE